MICLEKVVKRYCKDYTKIENYAEAVDSPEKWACHHRLETHNSDGERRLVDLSYKELKALDMYFNRPASELIFLTMAEHNSLHHKGRSGFWKGKKRKPFSEEWRRKQSEAKKGKNNPMFGRKRSDETKRKMSEAKKDRRWKLVDGKRVWY